LPGDLTYLGLNAIVLADARPHLEAGLTLGRVVREHRETYTVRQADREAEAQVTGRLRFTAQRREDFPAVGDWVMISAETDPVVIHAVLPRRTLLARKAAGERAEKQPIAANIDLVFIMQGLDRAFNLRRLERSMVLVRESGATPVVLLGKCDLADGELIRRAAEAASAVAADVELITSSAVTGEGLDRLRVRLVTGVTACIIGPSGAGKSTLINALASDANLPTNEVRESDARGRHTTSLRQMVFLPGGGTLIDTPGMRELGLWASATGLELTFPEIGELADECRFRDCSHIHEPECAVRLAVEDGRLPPGRFESYCKLRDEARLMERRTTIAGRRERKRTEKNLSKEIRRVLKRKGKK